MLRSPDIDPLFQRNHSLLNNPNSLSEFQMSKAGQSLGPKSL